MLMQIDEELMNSIGAFSLDQVSSLIFFDFRRPDECPLRCLVDGVGWIGLCPSTGDGV